MIILDHWEGPGLNPTSSSCVFCLSFLHQVTLSSLKLCVCGVLYMLCGVRFACFFNTVYVSVVLPHCPSTCSRGLLCMVCGPAFAHAHVNCCLRFCGAALDSLNIVVLCCFCLPLSISPPQLAWWLSFIHSLLSQVISGIGSSMTSSTPFGKHMRFPARSAWRPRSFTRSWDWCRGQLEFNQLFSISYIDTCHLLKNSMSRSMGSTNDIK